MNPATVVRVDLKWLRLAERILPLGRRYRPLVEYQVKGAEYASVPSFGYDVVIPVAWIPQFMHLFLGGLEAGVSDFFLVNHALAAVKDGHILDVGANMGWWSMLCSRATDAPITAFEPEPQVYKVLVKNLAHNRIATVQTRNAAAGDEDASIFFHTGANGYTLVPGYHEISDQDNEVIRVSSVRLDSLFAGEKVAFIKIDVEGYEWHVLQGAVEILKRWKPKLIVEIHPPQLRDRGRQAEEVLQFLKLYYPEGLRLYGAPDSSRSRIQDDPSCYHQAGFDLLTEGAFLELVGDPKPPAQVYAVYS